MWFKRIIVVFAFFAAGDPATAGEDRYSVAPALAQALSDVPPGSKSEIQNIQRLLKLLADRYPTTYGSVDPGRLDGSFGEGTRDAIRNFREISGSAGDSRKSGNPNNEQLVADILATLAQMSATQTADSATDKPRQADSETASASDIPAVTPPPMPDTTSDKAATANDTGKAPAPASRPAPPAPKPSGPAPSAKTAPEIQHLAAAKSPGQPADQRVYFVQAASLRSIESAKREWQRIFGENRAALTGEQVYFEQAEIAGRGVFYRILIGPMVEQDAAKTLCAFLKQNDQTCVVTVRNLADLPTAQRSGGQSGTPSGQKAGDEKRAATTPPPAPKPGQEPEAATPATAEPATEAGSPVASAGSAADPAKEPAIAAQAETAGTPGKEPAEPTAAEDNKTSAETDTTATATATKAPKAEETASPPPAAISDATPTAKSEAEPAAGPAATAEQPPAPAPSSPPAAAPPVPPVAAAPSAPPPDRSQASPNPRQSRCLSPAMVIPAPEPAPNPKQRHSRNPSEPWLCSPHS